MWRNDFKKCHRLAVNSHKGKKKMWEKHTWELKLIMRHKPWELWLPQLQCSWPHFLPRVLRMLSMSLWVLGAQHRNLTASLPQYLQRNKGGGFLSLLLSDSPSSSKLVREWILAVCTYLKPSGGLAHQGSYGQSLLPACCSPLGEVEVSCSNLFLEDIIFLVCQIMTKHKAVDFRRAALSADFDLVLKWAQLDVK